MPPQNKPVIHAFGLVIFQRRQVGQGGGFGFVQDGFGHGLEFAPARPLEIGRVGNLAQKTPPFDDDAVDVARAQKIGDPGVFAQGIFMDGGNDLFRARAIFGRHAVFQIAGDGLLAEYLMAGNGQPPAPAIFLAAKPKPGVKIGQVVNQFIERIARIFQPGGNGQAIALRKETHDLSAQRWHAGDIDQAEPPPEQGGAGGGGQFAADRHQRTAGAIGVEHIAFDWFPKATPWESTGTRMVRSAMLTWATMRLACVRKRTTGVF